MVKKENNEKRKFRIIVIFVSILISVIVFLILTNFTKLLYFIIIIGYLYFIINFFER